ncbi:Integrator complex subunit 9 [Podila clonocystis]|nr:Integrator complex subunit 9 [Podila clonocystis]
MFKLPDFSGIDLKSVDVVLISNFNHMLALPYLTEFTDFQGRIFATEPTIEFGRQHMIEFVSFFGTSVSSSPHHSIDRKQLVARSGSGLYPAYTMTDIKACIDKIQPVRFREHVIAFVSSSSIQTNLHPDLFDGSLLEKASTVIAADLCPNGATSYNSGVNDVCAKIAMTIARKGHVLVPCAISGFLFDLMEDIHLHLNHMGLTHQVQYAFISPVAETALQYSNILAECTALTRSDGTAELADAKSTTSTPACQWSAYKYAEPLQLGIGSLYETLAKGIFPQSFGTTSIAAISGSLSIYNNRMQLEPASVGGRQILALHSQRQLCGTMNLNTLLAGLAMIGVSDPVVTEFGEIKDMQEAEIRVEFALEGKDAHIIVRENETIVKCEEASRPLLRGAIVRCFQTL